MTTLQEKNLALIALLRRLYESFRYPDGLLAAELCGGNWVTDVEETASILGITSHEPWTQLQEYLSQSCSDREELLEELAVEYTRLFINAYGGTPAPPYGSVYLNEEHSLGGKTALQVLEWYRRAGVALPPDFPEAPDHLMVELEFLIHLTQFIPEVGNGEAAEDLVQIRREFWQEHFCRWVPRFVAKTVAESKNPLYTAAAGILGRLTQTEVIAQA